MVNKWAQERGITTGKMNDPAIVQIAKFIY